MAKDPAFLFYPNDWLGGTMGMTFEEKGAYMELLMMQFNRGHMTTHMIGLAIGQLFDKIKVKFIQDDQGLWFNERLDLEKDRRKNFVKSRHNNKEGLNQYSKIDKNKSGHMIGHMEDENENRNINGFEEKKGLGKKETGKLLIPVLEKIWLSENPDYPSDKTKDFAALGEISRFLASVLKMAYDPSNEEFVNLVAANWQLLAKYVVADNFFKSYSLQQVSKHFQNIIQSQINGTRNNKQGANGAAKQPASAGY